MEYFGKVFGVVTVAVPPHYIPIRVATLLKTQKGKCAFCGNYFPE
jgi:hypothetical protein